MKISMILRDSVRAWAAVVVGAVPLLLAHDVMAAMPDTIERIKPSVVAVGSYQKTRSPPFVYRGTGFAVGDGTLVATNVHVLPGSLNAENRETLMILTFAQGGEPQPRDATVLRVDKSHDLALLRISGAPLPVLTLDNADKVREGQTFAFTGFPVANLLGFSPVTHRGMISAVTPIALPSPTAQQLDPKVIRSVRAGSFNIFQLDATAYPGNSGSPMYDIETGQVVGIINMVFVKGTRETALSQPSGISFAVPVRFLTDLLSTPQ
jgi:S1-C subfamily serine protease